MGQPKPATNTAAFVFGLFTPIVITSIAGSGLFFVFSENFSWGLGLTTVYLLLLLAVFVALRMIGKRLGNVTMASMGNGGLWVVVPVCVLGLMALLAFGSCAALLLGPSAVGGAVGN